MSFLGTAFQNPNAPAGAYDPSMSQQQAELVKQEQLGAQQQANATQASQLGGLQNLGFATDAQHQLVSQLQANNGAANQGNVYAQQQALAAQLGQMAQGQGPNPAQAQLAQTTGQNIQSQAALMAGQRGAGANAGLIARQAAMQGGALNQQAAGQAATMRAQQQLAAISALQQQQGMLGQTAQAQVGNQQQAQGQYGAMSGNEIGAYNQALGNLQGNANAYANTIASQMGTANAQTAQQGQQIGQARQALGAVFNGAGALGSGFSGGGSGSTGGGSGVSGGGGMSGSGTSYSDSNYSMPALGSGAGYAQGGPVTSGTVNTPMPMQSDDSQQESGGGNSAGNAMKLIALFSDGGEANSQNQSANMKESYQGRSRIGRHLKASSHKGEIHNMKSGGGVPGKAKVSGAVNSYANDTVDAKLSPGEIVLPRSVTQSADPVSAAAKFVAAIQAKKGKK